MDLTITVARACLSLSTDNRPRRFSLYVGWLAVAAAAAWVATRRPTFAYCCTRELSGAGRPHYEMRGRWRLGSSSRRPYVCACVHRCFRNRRLCGGSLFSCLLSLGKGCVCGQAAAKNIIVMMVMVTTSLLSLCFPPPPVCYELAPVSFHMCVSMWNHVFFFILIFSFLGGLPALLFCSACATFKEDVVCDEPR